MVNSGRGNFFMQGRVAMAQKASRASTFVNRRRCCALPAHSTKDVVPLAAASEISMAVQSYGLRW